jgi:hypothetical protein
MIFGRLWEQTGCAAVIEHLAAACGRGPGGDTQGPFDRQCARYKYRYPRIMQRSAVAAAD